MHNEGAAIKDKDEEDGKTKKNRNNHYETFYQYIVTKAGQNEMLFNSV